MRGPPGLQTAGHAYHLPAQLLPARIQFSLAGRLEARGVRVHHGRPDIAEAPRQIQSLATHGLFNHPAGDSGIIRRNIALGPALCRGVAGVVKQHRQRRPILGFHEKHAGAPVHDTAEIQCHAGGAGQWPAADIEMCRTAAHPEPDRPQIHRRPRDAFRGCDLDPFQPSFGRLHAKRWKRGRRRVRVAARHHHVIAGDTACLLDPRADSIGRLPGHPDDVQGGDRRPHLRLFEHDRPDFEGVQHRMRGIRAPMPLKDGTRLGRDVRHRNTAFHGFLL